MVACPECYYVLDRIMPEVIEGFDLKITLLIDLVEREIKKGGLSFKPRKNIATFQDPCRLGRMTGHIDEPRNLLGMIPELELSEMENSGRSSICCGNNGFINCDAYSKRIQVERLRQAGRTGADLLVTACPKCMIHLTCAMRDPLRGAGLAMEIKDLVSVLADGIVWSDSD